MKAAIKIVLIYRAFFKSFREDERLDDFSRLEKSFKKAINFMAIKKNPNDLNLVKRHIGSKNSSQFFEINSFQNRISACKKRLYSNYAFITLLNFLNEVLVEARERKQRREKKKKSPEEIDVNYKKRNSKSDITRRVRFATKPTTALHWLAGSLNSPTPRLLIDAVNET